MKVPAIFNPDWLNKRDRLGQRRRDIIKSLLKSIVHDFLTFNVPHMAASIAFWGLFSMFPMVLAVIIITGDFLSYDAFIERIGNAIPVSRDFITDTLINISNDWPYTGTVAVIGLVWASLAVFAATRKGINAAWAIFRPRSFMRERVIDFSLMLGSWLIFTLSLSITPIIEFSRSTVRPARRPADAWGGYLVPPRLGPAPAAHLCFFRYSVPLHTQHPGPLEGRMARRSHRRRLLRGPAPRLRLVCSQHLHL